MWNMKARHPFLLLAALLSVSVAASGATYYVSSVSGNDSYTATQAQNQATPWKTLSKVNSFFSSLNPGDQVLLQAGSVFTGPLLATKSGTASQLITISIYGTGAAPIINGFTSLTGWVSVGGNVWQAPCTGCGLRVNMVDIAGSSQPMGRYPNTGAADGGYLQVQSFNGTTSFTDSHLGATNWTGADLVIRKNNWVIERDAILSQSGTTINYQTGSVFTPTVKFGYFIQNSLKTLDQNGEWYYDPVAGKMNLYSTTNPSGTSIQASKIDTLAKFYFANYIKLNGIVFMGANKVGISFYNSSTVTVTNCKVLFSGVDGIDGLYSNNLNIDYCTVDYSNSDGIYLNGSQNMVQDSKVQRTGTFPGMGNALDSYQAISVLGGYNTVLHNVVDTTGYTAINFMGNNNTIQNNLVDYFCYVKDDGGGIYTWSGDLAPTASKNTGWVTSNIVVHGVTAPAGTDSITQGIAHGVYLDENTTECYVTGNTVSHCSAGVFFQDTRNIAVQNNTLYDNAGQIVIRHAATTGVFAGNDVSNNFAVSNVDTENVIVISSVGPSSAIPSFAYMHNNHYAQVLSSANFCHVSMSNINTTANFGAWQATYGQDIVYSLLLPLNFLPYTINSLIGSDLYTKGTITLPFLNAVTGTRVVAPTVVGPLDASTWYATSFTIASPDNVHTMLVFLEQVTLPYPQLTQVIPVAMTTPSITRTLAFQTTAATASGGLVFQVQNSDPRISVSNITLYRANVTTNNPDQNVIFQYNASKAAVSLTLSGTYQDAGGTVYTGTVQIPAYGSLLLFKKT
jgi:parallel beta-helix repeat protein